MSKQVKSPDLRIVMAQQDFLVGAIEENAGRIIAACRQAVERTGRCRGVPRAGRLTRLPARGPAVAVAFHRGLRGGHAAHPAGSAGRDGARWSPGEGRGCALTTWPRWFAMAVSWRRYRKQHLPNYGVFDEMRYFRPGDSACIIMVRDVPVGITICEDIWPVGARPPGGRCRRAPAPQPQCPRRYHAGKGFETRGAAGAARQRDRPAGGLCQPGRRTG